MRSARGGFTLAELLIALTLGSLLIMAMSAMFLPVTGAQVDLFRSARVQGEALLAAKAIQLDLEQSSMVSVPAAGAPGDELAGCVNFDPAAGGALDSTRPVAGFRYCLIDGALRRGETGSCPPAAFVCGGASPVVASNIGRDGPNPLFTRRLGNVVGVRYAATLSGQTQTVDTSVQFQGAP